jgi:hypothetical protein
MTKDELRAALQTSKQDYLKKNEARLAVLQPKWEAAQATCPQVEGIVPTLEFCDSQDSQDLWWYGRVTVSSAPLSGEVGRRFHYLIRDKETGFILGIVGLASDLNIPIRDKFIGWDKEAMWKKKRINYLMNCQHVVATPEFSPYLTGKLAALSVLSKEVQDTFKTRYGHNLAALTVTSLYGKSSQYNRLSGFIYLGTTKGYSSVLIPASVKAQMREDFKKTKGKHAEIYYNEDGSIRQKYGVVKGYQKLAKYGSVQRIENFRGVYIIPSSHNYKEFLQAQTDTLEPFEYDTFDTVVSKWNERWFLPRLERIKNGTVVLGSAPSSVSSEGDTPACSD